MARVQTRERPSRRKKKEQSSEEHLDDWFARRLDAQGIPSKLGGFSTSRLLAVVGLGLALLAFVWALSSVGSSGSSTPTAASTPPGNTTAGTGANNGGGNGGGGGGNGSSSGPVTWKNVTVDVLNGFGGNGAAASAATAMRAAGWKVGQTGNATGIGKTVVVFLPGYKPQAKSVAKKLKLGAPVPIASEPGVAPDSTNGVAVVLGPDQLGSSGL